MIRPGLRSHRLILLPTILATGLALSLMAALAQRTESVEPQADRQNKQYWELDKVPEKARSRPNPLQGDVTAVPAGKKLFAQHCAECHGSTAEGKKKAPSLRSLEVQNAAPGALFWILTNGVVRRGMPVWSKLPDQQRWQIIAYLKSLQ